MGWKCVLGIWTSIVSATIFISYCIYFDRKRRSHPDFKAKLRSRRYQQKDEITDCTKDYKTIENKDNFQTILEQQVKLGLEIINKGDLNRGLELIYNAIVLSNRPKFLLGIVQPHLHPALFHTLVHLLPSGLPTKPPTDGMFD